jgi:hypothetical protein
MATGFSAHVSAQLARAKHTVSHIVPLAPEGRVASA